jgi:hypothetical protein
MSDLKERLNRYITSDARGLCREAAARIEALEAALAKSCDDMRFEDSDAGCPRAIKADIRIEALGAALREVMAQTWPGEICHIIARDALDKDAE